MKVLRPLAGPGVARGAVAAALAALVFSSASRATEGGVPALPQPVDHSAAQVKRKLSVVPSEKQIDINSANREQLKTLPGIGDAEAGRIIAGRPYDSKADLVGRKVLPEGLYISIRYRIKAVPVEKQPTKK